MSVTVIRVALMSASVITYHLGMGRWQPDARGRLEQAALELFLERGFEQTTVAEIAQRAGLTERTFFRHFADKREVLFAGAGALQDFLVRAVAQAPGSATPIDAIAGALQTAAPLFAERGDYPRQRQAVIAANAELQERELIKLAALAAAMAGALRGRGVPEPAASLAAQAGMAAFRIAFERWTAQACQPELATLIRESLDDLKAVTAGQAVTPAEYLCIDALGLTIRFCRSALGRMAVSGDRWQVGYGPASRCVLWRSVWPTLGCSFHGQVRPVLALGGESGVLPEPAGSAVVQDVASERQAAGIGLIGQAPGQSAPHTDVAEFREQGDVDDDDLVAGAVDDEPSGPLTVRADDPVGGIGLRRLSVQPPVLRRWYV
jgi:AcrR family transcriptional regulator